MVNLQAWQLTSTNAIITCMLNRPRRHGIPRTPRRVEKRLLVVLDRTALFERHVRRALELEVIVLPGEVVGVHPPAASGQAFPEVQCSCDLSQNMHFIQIL